MRHVMAMTAVVVAMMNHLHVMGIDTGSGQSRRRRGLSETRGQDSSNNEQCDLLHGSLR
jgi:hypothetical protein